MSQKQDSLCSTRAEKKSARIGKQEIYIRIYISVYSIYILYTYQSLYMYIYTHIKRAVYNQDEENEEGEEVAGSGSKTGFSSSTTSVYISWREEKTLLWES